jgi:hypothetical protein
MGERCIYCKSQKVLWSSEKWFDNTSNAWDPVHRKLILCLECGRITVDDWEKLKARVK